MLPSLSLRHCCRRGSLRPYCRRFHDPIATPGRTRLPQPYRTRPVVFPFALVALCAPLSVGRNRLPEVHTFRLRKLTRLSRRVPAPVPSLPNNESQGLKFTSIREDYSSKGQPVTNAFPQTHCFRSFLSARNPPLTSRVNPFRSLCAYVSRTCFLHPHAAWRFSRAKERPEMFEGLTPLPPRAIGW